MHANVQINDVQTQINESDAYSDERKTRHVRYRRVKQKYTLFLKKI